jgi:type I restriction enzyme M protein
MEEIEKNEYNLNISRYVSTAKVEIKIDLKEVNDKLVEIEKKAIKSLDEHNEFLKELGLKTI